MTRIVMTGLLLLGNTSLFGWELVLDRGGVKIYKQKSANSFIHEIKGTATITRPMLNVLNVVLDYKKFHLWQPNLITFERLKVINDREFINYAAMRMPWPVKPRDIVMRARIFVDSKSKWIHVTWNEANWPTKPVTKKFVRVPKSRVKWSLKSLNNGKATRIEFRALGNPGGWIPAWLVNWFSKYMIADSFKRLALQTNQIDLNKSLLQHFKFVETW